MLLVHERVRDVQQPLLKAECPGIGHALHHEVPRYSGVGTRSGYRRGELASCEAGVAPPNAPCGRTVL
jgi:hypothetical protein